MTFNELYEIIKLICTEIDCLLVLIFGMIIAIKFINIIPDILYYRNTRKHSKLDIIDKFISKIK